MPVDTTSPSPEQAKADALNASAGAGGSRYKEYDIAPYVVAVRAQVPPRIWPGVLYSWLSLKGHMQGIHSLDTTYMFARVLEDGRVLAMFYVVFSLSEGLSTWLEEGYTVDRMLTEIGVPAEGIDVQIMRDYS
jgi:hypothetical protein